MEKEILLSSGLTQDAFGKSNLGVLINEKGLEVVNGEMTEWAFFKTFSGDDGFIYFSGAVSTLSDSDEVFSLADILDFDDEKVEIKKSAVFELSKFLTSCIEKGYGVPTVGFGGVYFVVSGGNIQKMIFLPEEIFSRCANCQDEKTKAKLIGTSTKKSLKGEGAAAFLRAASIYKLLSKKDAYDNENATERNIDMLDGKFLPSCFAFPTVPKELSDAIDAGLKITSDFVKKSKRAKKAENTAIKKFPIEELLKLKTEEIVSATNSETEKDATEKFLKKQNAAIKTKRFVRRNKNGILVFCIAVLIAFYAINSFHKSNLELATSIGCTAKETAKILYQGINDADVTIVQEVAKGKQIKDLETMVVGLHVKYKSHQAMEENGGNLSPTDWLLRKGKSQYWLYGITNLEIDGEKTVLTGDYPTRKNHGDPIKAPTENQNAAINAKYFLVHSDSDYRINVIENTETLSLKWKKNRWIVTEISSKAKQKTYDTKKFREDYIAALEANNDDVGLAAESLKTKYLWLPDMK